MTRLRDFPDEPVVKNTPSNAGDTGSIPGRGTKIPQATREIGPHTTTTEPTHSTAGASLYTTMRESQGAALRPSTAKKVFL